MIEKPKKERRFLKALGRVGEILIEQVLIKVGSSLIKRIGGKKTLPSILFLFLSISLFAQFPNTGNKQRLGFQTTADGLVWRGSISDTASIQPVSNQNAWVILDTVNLKIYSFDFTSNVWNQVGTGGGSAFTQPIDSLFFKTSVSPNNVDTAKMRWDSELGTVVLGMYDAVPNELGFKNFWLVKNQTGSTITKNSLVYASGTVGASGRILVSKFIANGTIDAKYLLGITAHDLSNGEDGYVISFGKIRQVNTDTFAAGAILYPSPTTAGVWTDVEPVAPNIDLPIGFCINSSSNNGTISIRVASGYSLNELHNVAITSPVEKSSLFYSDGLWRDTTAALLVSDTASMLTPYFKKSDTTSLNLTSRFAAKLNISDTSSMLTNYLRSGVAASTYLPLTGGTLTGALNVNGTSTLNFTNVYGKNTYVPFNVGTGEQSIFNVGAYLRGGTVMIFPDSSLAGSSGNLFFANSNILGVEFSARGSGIRNYIKQGGDNNRNSLALYTSDIGQQNTNRLYINYNGDIGINDDTPIYKLDVNGTLGVTGATTLSSTLSGTTGTFKALTINNNVSSGEGVLSILSNTFNDANKIQFGDVSGIRREILLPTGVSSLQFRTYALGGTEGGYSFYTRRNPNAEQLAFNIDFDGNSNFYGTLGVTGATTLTGALTVNNATVLNEGSGDFDTRIESDGNANMVFVDASTDRVGIGTGSPSKTLDVNGEVKIATVTTTPTALLGKDASNVVGEVTTVAQTGLMTRGSTTATTGTPSAVFNVTHGLGSNPTAVIVTSAGIAGAEKIIFEVYAKNSTTFSVQAWNYDGTEAASTSVTIYWLAIK
jgi:hypothetical protein